MAIAFTAQQTKVLEARNHNILVSAAAGSGKTAVLTERILRMISEGDSPLDIDRLLVVTFTKAAAAQMRDRIGRAISQRLVNDPGNVHLQRQEVLIHNAKITTMDSFFTYLLRNNFTQIGIDPGFRQMDQTEADLMRRDALEDFLEEKYAQGDPDFLACAMYFSPGRDDKAFEEILDDLYKKAVSHPEPIQWLLDRAGDYAPCGEEELQDTPWMQFMLRRALEELQGIRMLYEHALDLCGRIDGPYMLSDFIREEMTSVLGTQELSAPAPGTALSHVQAQQIYSVLEQVLAVSFGRYPSVSAKRYPNMDPAVKDAVKKYRDNAKKRAENMKSRYHSSSPEMIRSATERLDGPVSTLAHLAAEYLAFYGEVKKEKNVIDFADLEHLALQILADRLPDGTYRPTAVCRAYRQYFAEVLIDEYQDSNEIQELLLQLISREDEGDCNRFMVGDVKQSIYKFRLARPEIFMDKYAHYAPDDPQRERIELDANFRSRHEVIDSVNAVFARIMRSEIGGIEYTPDISLKAMASYPEAKGEEYITELVLAGISEEDEEARLTNEDSEDRGADALREMNSRQREALVAAHKIRELVGKLPVTGEDGTVHMCRYSDICILLRSGRGWFEDFKKVFAEQGIPAYIQSRTGYFAAREIRSVMELLRVLDNPRQDIPLYGVMRGFWGGFTDEELALLRAQSGAKEMLLYDLAGACAQLEEDASGNDAGAAKRREKCRKLLSFINRWRGRVQYMQVHTLLAALLEETGYENYCRALPGGAQRYANLQMLQAQAAAFDKMALQGLFDFIRYIDQMKEREIDYGEASMIDENADVVKLMSIHKSKGLEFPVCIVAGLGKEHSYKRRDAAGHFMCENNCGIGADVYDADRQLRYSTFRGEAIAEKIRTDSLGEELRVLYVAMTRAKEKLILTAYLKNMDTKCGSWEESVQMLPDMRVQGAAADEDTPTASKGYEKLPAQLIAGTESFLNLVWLAYAAGGPVTDTIKVTRTDLGGLLLGELQQQAGMGRRREQLMAAGEKGGAAHPLPDLERELDDIMTRQYAGQNLAGLYTKTSVSELKMAAMREEGEEADMLFPEPIVTPVIPSFMEEEGKTQSSGASYGTAVHRILELFDYRLFTKPYELSEKELREWMERLAADGLIPQSYVKDLYLGGIMGFLQDPLAKRMADAARCGRLYREQPFVLGTRASALRTEFPQDEWVLIQGIIDAYFEENGELILVDYKTDRVTGPQELVSRYKTQIEYYTQALTQITGRPVRERILYGTALRQSVRL